MEENWDGVDGKTDYVAYGELKIRRFEPGEKDTAGILSLLGEILTEYGFTIQEAGSEKDCKDIAGSYSTGGFWIVENEDGHIVGTAGYRHFAHGGAENCGELRRLYINGKYRRIGLGRMLLAAMENIAHSNGFEAMILESAGVLVEARKLYLKYGYVDCELPDGASLTNRCDVVMEKKLHFDKNDKEIVHVVYETGQRFAQLPLQLAKRGHMRLYCVVVVVLKMDEVDNVLIRVVTGGAKVQDILQSIVSTVGTSVSGDETIRLVSRGVHAERKDSRLCCDLYMTTCCDVTRLDRSKWMSDNESKFVIDSSPSLAALIAKIPPPSLPAPPAPVPVSTASSIES